MAKAGLELALWDIQGKKEKKPLWKLYGGINREIPAGVSIGIQNSVPELLDRIRSFTAEGYQRIKVKIKPGWDIDVLEEVRKKFPEMDFTGGGTIVVLLEPKSPGIATPATLEFSILPIAGSVQDPGVLLVDKHGRHVPSTPPGRRRGRPPPAGPAGSGRDAPCR